MSENLLGCVGPGADAVGDADAAVAVAGECETGQLLAQTLDAVEAFQVADAVLAVSSTLLKLQLAFPFAKPGAPAVVQGVKPAGIRLAKPALASGPRAGFELSSWNRLTPWLPT